MSEKKVRRFKTRKIITNLILVVAVCVFCYAAFNLFQIYKANFDEKSETNRLRDIVDLPQKEQDLALYKVNFKELKAINQDIIGWIIIKDTEISYPIVQGSDNDYYLTHTFEKKSNYAGAIFMDYKSSADFSNANTFIYGHNVFHGTMFTELSKYMDKTYFDEHPLIYIYTPDKTYTLNVFSAYNDRAMSSSYQMSFNNNEEFSKYLEDIKNKSRHQSTVKVSENDRIVSLYTCSYEDGQNPNNTNPEELDDRYFIHAKIKEN